MNKNTATKTKQLNVRNQEVPINSFLGSVAGSCSSVDRGFLVVNKGTYKKEWYQKHQ